MLDFSTSLDPFTYNIIGMVCKILGKVNIYFSTKFWFLVNSKTCTCSSRTNRLTTPCNEAKGVNQWKNPNKNSYVCSYYKLEWL